MQFWTFVSVAAVGLVAMVQAEYSPEARMNAIVDQYHRQSHAYIGRAGSHCTKENLGVRKDWESLHQTEKASYLSAVQCLLAKPSQTGGLARNRYEDFVMSDVNQTLFIHNSGLLLPWHRKFILLFETALRNECGYPGYLPYWDWSKYVAKNGNVTIMDGSATSLGGNGLYVHHGPFNITLPGGPLPRQSFLRPAGTGGGCVPNGPFKNISVHIGPGSTTGDMPIVTTIKDTPRCLKRDFSMPLLAQTNSYQNVTDLILNSADIHTFHPALEQGVHPNGHSYIGGEQLDLFVSPNDPIFYLHHAMVDRVWAIWQGLDFEKRRNALDGTLTMLNDPPTHNATVKDPMNFGSLAPSVEIGTVISSFNGDLCYIYA